MSNRLKTVTEKGHTFVMVPGEAWLKIASGTAAMPQLPPTDADGNMDALEFARATIARGIIRDRIARDRLKPNWREKPASSPRC